MKKALCGLVAMALCSAGPVAGGDGVWTSPLGGLWSEALMWAGGDAAGGGGHASFEVAGGTVAVTNDVTGLALSGLTFNAAGGNQADWVFSGREIEIVGNPVVNVAAGRAEFNAVVKSADMMTKAGNGALFFEAGLTGGGGVTLQGGVFEVRNGRELGSGRFNWNGGVLKAVPGEAGLQESSSPNNNINLGTYGTNTSVTLNLRMADRTVCNESTYPQNTQYIYRGRWYVPQDGVYSFAKDFDDCGYLAIDNCVLFNNGTWDLLLVVRDVPLRQGWHDVEARVSQGSGGVGPQKEGSAYGIMFDPNNGDFSTPQLRAGAESFIDPGNGSVLRSDMQTCALQLVFLNNDVTLDASAMPPDYTPALMCGIQTNAAAASVPKLTVVGGDGRLLIGSQTLFGYPSLHAVFNADATAANGILFGGKVALYRLPTACAWEILPHTDLLIGTAGILGSGPLTLTNHSVRINSEDALNGPYPITIKGTDNRVYFDPTENINGSWAGNLTLTLAHDVSMVGNASAAVFTGRGTCYYDGTISGTGSLLKTDNSTAHLRGVNTFEGDVQISGGRLNVYAPTVGVHTNPVSLTNGGTLSFVSPVTEAYIHSLGGVSGTLDIPAGQTLTVNELNMTGTLNVSGAGALCVSNSLSSATRLSVSGGVRLEVPQGVAFAQVTLANDGVMLEVSGEGTLGGILGAGSVIKRGNGTMTLLGAAGFDGNIVVAEGSLALSFTDTSTFTAPTLWLDASKGASLDHSRNENSGDPDKDIVSTWQDWRGNGRYAQVQGLPGSQNYDRPYLLPDECNGLPVMSCGNFTTASPVQEYRRMKFNSDLNCWRVIMVFGSQLGGGHILGSDNNSGSNTNFLRGTALDTTPPVASDPIWKYFNHPVRLDGVSVDGLTTGLSGGYQIINTSFSSALTINLIGMANRWQNAGGQRYGEALFFTSSITDSESRLIEAYLGSKWGIPCGRVSQVTVQAGANLLVDGTIQIDSLHGDGTVIKTGPGALRIGGAFSGTIDVQEGTLEPAALPPPPAAASLPLNNMTLWLDACETNRITSDTLPGQVFQWLDRRPNVNRFAFGYWTTAYRERPWLIETPAPRGGSDPLTWVDFLPNLDEDPLDSSNKYMKFCIDVNPVGYVQDQNRATFMNIRTGFMVLDSLRGGGQPMERHFARGTPWNVASTPVWSSGGDDRVRNGNTRLDGLQVNGRTTGYNGAVQVLSFTTTSNAELEYLANSKQSLERIGEFILFDTVLSSDTRRAYEAYLLNKWKGASALGYHYPGDPLAGTVTIASGVTLDVSAFNAGEIGSVSCPGTLRTSDFAALPPINGPLGNLEVLAGDITFDVSAQGAAPEMNITGALTVPSAGTLTLNFTEQVKGTKTITLFTYATLTGSGFDGWTLALTGDTPNGATVRLRQGPTETYAEIILGGTLLMIR